MTPWKICGLAAVDERTLTPADKEQLLREHEAMEVRRRLGGNPLQRPGCTSSTPASRLNARQNRYGGADSFDSRGCTQESVGRAPALDGKE
jgi:hypothetical protein